MSVQASESQIKEHIWLVALYENEAQAEELLERLSAIGIDVSEATTVRVEIDDQQRSARFTPVQNSSQLSPITRGIITGALTGAALALMIGLAVYGLGVFTLQVVEGLFGHAVSFAILGALAGAVIGILLASAKQRKISGAHIPRIQQLKSEGFLVAVKMAPQLAEQAEEIARGLGAKEILL